MAVLQYSSDCGIAFKLPALVADLSFLLFLFYLFLSQHLSYAPIPYYAALHCHNPYITCQSDESEFMVQGASSASRISENFSKKKRLRYVSLVACHPALIELDAAENFSSL